MNRNEKKKTFVMFCYACSVSRVHQEFELFEQIFKNCANFKEKCCGFLLQ